ncbi:unnamed protein product [Sphagnum balticum]
MREGRKEGRREECEAPRKCERDDDVDDDDAQAKIGFSCCSNKANLQFANLCKVSRRRKRRRLEDLCFAKWFMVSPNFGYQILLL